MAMTTRDVTTPEQLVAAWRANEMTAWDAVAVILHSVNESNVAEWVLALPLRLQAHLIDEVTSWGASDREKLPVGRGAGLEEAAFARPALRTWLRVGDDPEQWLSPEIVARLHAEEGVTLPRRFVACAESHWTVTGAAEEGSRWNLAVEQVAGSAVAWLAVLTGAESAGRLPTGAVLAMRAGGEVVGSVEILLNAHRVREIDFLADDNAPPRRVAAA
jgi:hypothetical protein